MRGKVLKLISCFFVDQDHLRLCGEKLIAPFVLSMIKGSPPPMRGKEKAKIRSIPRQRITPAYAGKSHHVRCRCKVDVDHPRLCGEKSQRSQKRFWSVGSPPPMRGKGYLCAKHAFLAGITPAYAGKRYSWYHLLFCF